jgi:hypothetical protein
MKSVRSVALYVTIALVYSFCVRSAVARESQEPAAKASAELSFKITDDEGNPLPCRIHFTEAGGQPVKVDGYPYWRDHFVCDGEATVKVLPGKYRWQIERGPEFVRMKGDVNLEGGNSGTVSEQLRRLVNLREAGWYSADMHIHRPVKDIKLLMRAEDLDFGPVITWWNKPAKDVNPRQQTTFPFDGHRLYNIMAGEDEREGGALLYFGLDRPLDLSVKSREFPSPMQFVGQARELNPNVWIDIEKPFWWDVPVWLASGKMDSIGLANNHMCHSRMYESEAWGRPRDVERLPNPRGNGFWSQEIYYHLLNAGLRMPPSAGSASGVLPNPVGYNRVYVHLDEPFTRDSFFEALKAGRSFVTNGPLLRVQANDKRPGATLQKSDDRSLAVELAIDLTTNDPLRKLEVIHNGKVIEQIPCSNDALQKLIVNIDLAEPGWFLVRVIADVDETFRFASTAPWYVESPSVKSRISRASAQFFLDWVDERMERIRKNVTDPDQLRAVLEPHEQARLFWQQRVREANAD